MLRGRLILQHRIRHSCAVNVESALTRPIPNQCRFCYFKSLFLPSQGELQ